MSDLPRHMTPEEFRRFGREMVDWIADYHASIEARRVLSDVEPGAVRAALPAAAPEQGEPFERVVEDLEQIIMPGITHWQSPSFFAFFPSNISGPAILGELLSAGLGVQGMLWATSPACTELETHVLDWLVEAMGLPRGFLSSQAGGGVIQDTASSAALCALVAARQRALDRHPGATIASLRAYTSSQAHSSIQKALRIAGFTDDQLRVIETDEEFAMQPRALAEVMSDDARAGAIPFFVAATAGTTSSLAMDPLVPIGEACRSHGAWMHVDAAMAGSAAICAEHRAMHEGLDVADSYCFNPHKWMLVNFDCDCFFVADRAALVRALSILPEYLRNSATEAGTVIDYRDWQIPLGRRFRALKLWMTIRWYGLAGLRAHIRHHVEMTAGLAERIRADARFELVAPVRLNLICFRLRGGDERNQALLDRLNAGGRMYLTHTRLAGRYTLRLCIGATSTQPRHVNAAWREIAATADAV